LQTIPTTSNDDDAPVPQYIAGMHYEKSGETKRRNLYEAKISPIPETIDSRDEPMPKLYTSFAINDDSAKKTSGRGRVGNIFTLFKAKASSDVKAIYPTTSNFPSKDAVILDLYSDEKSIKEHQSNESVHSSVYSPNAVKEKLAVASPVEYDEEPVYAAVECNPLSKPSLLKNRRCRVYSALALLLIGNNNISGTKTSEIRNLKNLRTLNIDSNYLSVTIALSFTKLSNLRSCTLGLTICQDLCLKA
jgi:hypothetical protein